MSLIIVSSSPSGRVAERICQAATTRGLQCRVVGVKDIASLSHEDIHGMVVLPRISPEQNAATERLGLLEAAGARIVNPASSWAVSRDKWQTYELLRQHAVPTPKTLLASTGMVVSPALGLGERVVFKPRYGTHGEGIVVLRSGDVVSVGAGVLQEYIDTGGADVRLFVVGDSVVAAIRRQAKPGDFRANLHQGASAHLYHPTEAMQAIAVHAAKSMGLQIAGVDILVHENEVMVIEVNPSPGLGIERHSGVDVAGAMIDAIATGRVWL